MHTVPSLKGHQVPAAADLLPLERGRVPGATQQPIRAAAAAAAAVTPRQQVPMAASVALEL